MARIAVELSCSAEQRTELVALPEAAPRKPAWSSGRGSFWVAWMVSVMTRSANWASGEYGRSLAQALCGRGDSRAVRSATAGQEGDYGPALRLRIRRRLELPPPKGLAGWDGGSLSAALGVSDAAVWRVLRKEGLQLRRHRSWCVSTDPQFAAKAADIIGLYLDPPENALVLSVDEKPTIQALERASGYVQTSSGKIVQGLKSTYKRHGTINLFAALEVATGLIHGKTTQSKKRVDFQAFMDEIIDDHPTGRYFNVILDNTVPIRRTKLGLPPIPTSPSTSRRLRQAGLTKSRSGSVSSPERPCRRQLS